MAFQLDGYVDVAERIQKFYASHPDGSIVARPPEVIELDGRYFIGVTVSAYRTPEDPVPCVGSAWEPYPGKTPYTKDSEMMNAETSAVGRALALAGIEVRKSIATSEEVRNRQADRDEPEHPLAERVRTVQTDMKRLTDTHREALKKWADGRKLSGSALLADEKWLELVEAWLDEQGEPSA